MTRIRFRCPCGQKLSAPVESAGKRGKCPICGKVVHVPLRPDPLDARTRRASEDDSDGSSSSPWSRRPTDRPEED